MTSARVAWWVASALPAVGLLLGGAALVHAPVGLAQERGATAPRASGAGAGGATARDTVRAEVFVVLAAEAEGTIDPALAEIPALRQPPFHAFHSMSVLSRSGAELTTQSPIEVALPNGRQLRVELERPMPDGRYRVRVSINTPGQTDYLPLLQIVASPGDPFFVAGQNWQGGTLVIGVRIGQRPTARKAS